MKGFASLLVVFASILLALPTYGFTISTLWGWFVAPIFHTRLISFGEALGLSLFYMALTMPTKPSSLPTPKTKDEPKEQFGERQAWAFAKKLVSEAFLVPAGLLLFGWLWHSFFI